MADGCDIVGGLKESMKNEWSGDADFNDGTVHKLHQKYTKSLRFLAIVGVRARSVHDVLMSDFKHLQSNLEIHLTHLSSSGHNFVVENMLYTLIDLMKFSSEYSAKIAKRGLALPTHSTSWRAMLTKLPTH